MGRTGDWFAHTATGVVPDVVTLAKGLGGGMPIGATVALGAAGTLLQPGNHGTTFGGNPVATAAALAVIDTIEAEGLLANATPSGSGCATAWPTTRWCARSPGAGCCSASACTPRSARRRTRRRWAPVSSSTAVRPTGCGWRRRWC